MADHTIAEQLEALQAKIRERALRLCDLEIIIYDYDQERQRLLEELIELKEQYWDLVGARLSEYDD
ncbi:MAG: hypothetical protein MAG451_00810 [Anaerolineales bacterium]|nr:hypothetical protein [Anaerolineales bacterium]